MTEETPRGSSFDPRLEQVAVSYLNRLRGGERPSVEEYAERYPELAAEIRDALSALLLVEELSARTSAGSRAARIDVETGLGVEAQGNRGHAAPVRLGEYQLLEQIGRGGMGVVYEAVQKSLKRRVALKILPYYSLLDERLLERFRREAQAAAKLHHPNIVPVYGSGVHEGVHYYAMQYIEGRGLDSVLKEIRRLRNVNNDEAGAEFPDELTSSLTTGLLTDSYPLLDDQQASRTSSHVSTGEAASTAHEVSVLPAPGNTRSHALYYRGVARLTQQGAEALEYAHEHGVLHRDVKPSNLLLDRSGTVWVADFGLAKDQAVGDLTATGELVGTLRYMPPERFQGEGDRRSDVYSLGLTLYELLTLRPAFAASDRSRLLNQLLEEEPPRPRGLDAGIPRDLERITLKAIQKEPELRYQTAGELAADLECFQRGLPVKASTPLLGYVTRTTLKRHRVLILSCLLLGCGVAGYLGFSWLALYRAIGPNAISVADYDADGDLDLAVSNFDSANVSVVLDPGRDGESVRTYPTGVQPNAVTAADFDEDGAQDIVVANTDREGGSLSIFLNRGDGSFGEATPIGFQETIEWVVARDFDKDGKVDLAVSASDTNLYVLENMGGGVFSEPQTHEVAKHVTFVAASDCCPTDGNIDLVTASGRIKRISVLKNEGGGGFAAGRSFEAGDSAWRLELADLDGDGDQDLVAANYVSENVSVFLNAGDGIFAEPASYPSGGSVQSVAAADIDGDGDTDLVVAAFQLSFLANDGAGTFAAPVEIPTEAKPSFVRAVDWDGDGDPDLLLCDYIGHRVLVLYNEGGGSLEEGESISLSPWWARLISF